MSFSVGLVDFNFLMILDLFRELLAVPMNEQYFLLL